MTQPHVGSQDVGRSAPVPLQPAKRNGTPDHRLPNLVKLYHVPVFALRELIEDRATGKKYSHLRQAELIRKVDEMPAITEADIQNLYENYRYGRRLSFYLYLLPDGLTQPDLQELQVVLDELATLSLPDLLDQITAGKDYEQETSPNQVILLDEEELDGYREIRFRYYITHRFLNFEEEPDHVLQSRYGFLWLDLNLGYLAILSRDERVNRLLTRALSHSLQAIPLPVRFPKELLDKHFSIEKAKRLSYYDPGTGVRRSISGQGLWRKFASEIMAREQQYARPSSLYDEIVTDGVISGVGVTASKGKIYLTKTLPTSVVRDWARRRLPDLMRDVKELRQDQPETFSRSTEAMNRMRLPSPGKAALVAIVEALLQTEREQVTTVDLPMTAFEMYRALAGKYFDPYLRAQCLACGETAELCPYCENRYLEFEKQEVRCKNCGETVSNKESVALRCMNGHITTVPRSEAWNIAPNHWLQKRMTRIFSDVGRSWDEKQDYFHIEGSTLYRLRKGELDTCELPPVIQNYISNFWDPVTGQVHAGSGDIVIGSPPADRAPQPAPAPRRARIPAQLYPITHYHNFDLRIRGDARTGYTISASVGGGARTFPQPLGLPSNRVTSLRLNSSFRRASSNGDMQATGEALFKALFPPPIRKLWVDAVGELGEDQGLRLTLHIEAPELMRLPWELLFEEEYIGLRQRFPIVRFLDSPNPPEPVVLQPPLRVLVAVCPANGTRSPAAQAELGRIRDVLAQMPNKVEVDVLESASRDELLAHLRQGYHVLHYIGQGMVQGGQGYLVLQDAKSRSSQASATLLGHMTEGSKLRLMVLSPGQSPDRKPRDVLDNVAHSLVRAGIPAVVAMPMAMEETAAVAFNHTFYHSLATALPVDVAVQEARRNILNTQSDGNGKCIDWAIPTLTMRAPDGVILGIEEEETDMLLRREEIKPTVTFTPTFQGPIYGPVHTGTGRIQVNTLRYGVNADELGSLFEALYRLVDEQAPPDQKQRALQEIDALKEAIEDEEPDLGKMESVLRWFKRNLPQLAGAVSSVILHPIVGQVVEAAGEVLATEFRRRFGG